MAEWTYVETQPSEQFCQLHQFAIKQKYADGDVEFIITVREYIDPPDPAMKFLAEADKQTNQQTAPYTPMGWGPTIAEALSECLKAVRRFPYEPAAAR